jgi:hypothetical protein
MMQQFVIPFFGRMVGVFSAMKQVVANLAHVCDASASPGGVHADDLTGLETAFNMIHDLMAVAKS